MSAISRPSWWVAAAAGASAAIFVVAFMVLPWPSDLLAIPGLVAWSLVLSALHGSQAWKQSWQILALLSFCAVVLGGAMTFLLSRVS